MKKSLTYRFSVLFLAGILWACALQEAEKSPDNLTIVSWNVQNLFDGIDNGFEYSEFTNSAGWNSEKYQARLQSIAAALKGESGVKADILALIEIENDIVLQDLADGSCLDYGWSFFAGAENSSVGLGVLSALPITDAKAHSFYSGDGGLPRPVAEVWIDTGSEPLVLLVCHWKSKVGGEKQTEALRRSASALIARRLAEIETESAGTPVVILGDLNENYDEFSRTGALYTCALLPDTAEAAALVQKLPAGRRPEFQDFLVLCGNKPPILEFFAVTGGILYSPWFELEEWPERGNGSYFYQDDWETIDHFLLNAALFNEMGLDYSHFRILAEPPFTNAAGHPNTYNPRTGNGLSDHLPIVLVLNKCSGYIMDD